MNDSALFIIDVQKDFCSGGALAVREGDCVVPVCNELIRKAIVAGCVVAASRDWHVSDHCSFKENGGMWPVHCVANTKGAEFHDDLVLPEGVFIVDKDAVNHDAYSAFDGTGAAKRFQALRVKKIVICGLATDYCVKFTTLDALKAGFEVVLVRDACRAVNVQPEDEERALDEVRAAGAQVLLSSEVQF